MSFLDMRLFYLSEIMSALKMLDEERQHIGNAPDWDKQVRNVFSLVEKFRHAIFALDIKDNLKATGDRINSLMFKLTIMVNGPFSTAQITPSELYSEVSGIVMAFKNEIYQHQCIYLEPKDAKFFNRINLLGDAVYIKFPEAEKDIQNAGTCLALGLSEAAVYHLMNAVNFAMIRLARKFKCKISDIEYKTWKVVLDEINKQIEAIEKLSAGPKKEAKINLYKGLSKDISFFKDRYRNPMAHSRIECNEEEAHGAFVRVRDFMHLMVKAIPGKGKKGRGALLNISVAQLLKSAGK